MNETEILIRDRLNKLPKEVISALSKMNWIKKTQEIAHNHSLDQQKSDKLVREVGIIVLGMEAPNKFPENIFESLDIDEDTSINIAREVGSEIFEPIKSAVENPSEPELNIGLSPEPSREIHPMVEEGEKAHDTTPEKKKFMNMENTTPAPKVEVKSEPVKEAAKPEPKLEISKPEVSKTSTPTSYPGGKDPYREPLD